MMEIKDVSHLFLLSFISKMIISIEKEIDMCTFPPTNFRCSLFNCRRRGMGLRFPKLFCQYKTFEKCYEENGIRWKKRILRFWKGIWNPVKLPSGSEVGMTRRYVLQVAKIHLPSAVTSIPRIGSPQPGSVLFARGAFPIPPIFAASLVNSVP